MINPASINLADFLANWYGSPDLPPDPLPAEYDWLPTPLKEWHRLSSQWDRPLARHNRMIPLERIKLVNRKAIFLEEESQEWRSAFDSENPDIVYEGEIGEEWKRSAETLSETIKHHAVQEITTTARFQQYCSELRIDRLTHVLAPLEQVGFGGWRWHDNPNCRIFMNETIVATIDPFENIRYPQFNKPGYATARVASNDLRDLSYLDEIQEIEWRKIQL
ncbi:hypothetical protein [Streptomyces sp. NBC_00057]|uniref:hypothetical protein n=1 Tax=Streptomyces sp. NBC_00057 TaxID=2975634 RepID=UPI003249EDE0